MASYTGSPGSAPRAGHPGRVSAPATTDHALPPGRSGTSSSSNRSSNWRQVVIEPDEVHRPALVEVPGDDVAHVTQPVVEHVAVVDDGHVRALAARPPLVPQRGGVAPPADDDRVRLELRQERVHPVARPGVIRRVGRVEAGRAPAPRPRSSRASPAMPVMPVVSQRDGAPSSGTSDRHPAMTMSQAASTASAAHTTVDQERHQVVALDVRVLVAQQEPHREHEPGDGQDHQAGSSDDARQQAEDRQRRRVSQLVGDHVPDL